MHISLLGTQFTLIGMNIDVFGYDLQTQSGAFNVVGISIRYTNK
jgi:hypothetical protein